FNRRILELIDQRQRETKLKNRAYYNEHGLKYVETKIEKLEPKKLNTQEIEKENTQKRLKSPSEDIFVYSTEDFIKDCSILTKELCTADDNTTRSDLDILLAINTVKARIHHIDFFGQEQEVDFCAIGSGSAYVESFLKRFWSESMTIEQIIRLCFFCIYYVQDLKLDSGVGMEGGVFPDYLVITHDGQIAFWKDLEKAEVRDGLYADLRTKIDTFKTQIDNLNF
ncbi:MAG: hypothetical protein NT001_05035, partial [Candidatus Woesearchaeota archaeon]|nr:hypothetical protein [Candidatus Woesearchaeota archaeon]